MVLLYLLFQRFYRSVALKPVSPGKLNDVGPRSGAGTGYFKTDVVVAAVCQLHITVGIISGLFWKIARDINHIFIQSKAGDLIQIGVVCGTCIIA